MSTHLELLVTQTMPAKIAKHNYILQKKARFYLWVINKYNVEDPNYGLMVILHTCHIPNVLHFPFKDIIWNIFYFLANDITP